MSAWGLPEEYNSRGNLKKVWLPKGVVIPCFTDGNLVYLKIRRFVSEEQISAGEQKYIKVKGSKPGLFGADNLSQSPIAVFTEGEFDTMLLAQEAGSLVGVASLGSATDRISRLDMAVWGKYILPLTHILTAYDNDEAGERGRERLAAFSDRVKHLRIPAMRGVKDITDIWGHVFSLSEEWLQPEMRRVGVLPEPISKPRKEHASLLAMLLSMGGELRGSWPAESAPENPWFAVVEHYPFCGGDSRVE